MYASRRIYVKQHDFEEPRERYSVGVVRGGKPVAGIQPDRISAVEEELMYWRKANHIHAWFVENVQKGEDDCREYGVSLDQLKKLLKVCSKVIKASKLKEGKASAKTLYTRENPEGVTQGEPGKVIEDARVARALLPTTEGFFFGSLEYDESYLEHVKDTRDWIQRTLKEIRAGVPGYIIYQSSW